MNENDYKMSKMLFIKGVFIKDCVTIGDIFERQIMEQIEESQPIVDVYQTLPSIFCDLETWVKTTNINCWFCDLTFESTPVFIPSVIEIAATPIGYKIGTYGCFCSFCCAMSFNNLHNNKLCKNITVKEMLLFLYKIYNRGVGVKEILQSPSKYQMVQYGGSVDPTVYKNKINELKKKMKLLEIPN